LRIRGSKLKGEEWEIMLGAEVQELRIRNWGKRAKV
jgi:hypothetical protein